MKIYKIIVLIVLIFIAVISGALYLNAKKKPLTVVNEYVLNLKDEEGKVSQFEYGSLPSLTNPDYYKDVKQQLITAGADFVDADLSLMKLAVYKKGQKVVEVPIAAKGRPGSWFETPAGLYKAEDKRKTHYSSFEPVYMNWNIPFQGNYFIHGWPRFNKTKAPVSSEYSAGCIRLTDEDAKTVYDLVNLGMPILVYEDSKVYNVADYSSAMPEINGKTYLAIDLDSNFVFIQKNQNYSYPLADFSKLLQSFVISEYMSFEKKILMAEKEYTPYDLIFPLLIEKSNEVSDALSSSLGKEYTVRLMNKKAESLGMEGTEIVTSSGISIADVTTARDLSQLAKALSQYRSFILNITKDPNNAMIYGPIKFQNIKHDNLFKDTNGYVGGMFTRGEGQLSSVLAVFSDELRGHKRNVAIISMNTEKPYEDIINIWEYVNRVYR